MKSVLILLAAASVPAAAAAQMPQEITFFSNTGMTGARFTVTGQRNYLDLPYIPRSASLQAGGTWQICSGSNFSGRCERIRSNQLTLNFGQIRSIRPIETTAPNDGIWREVARLNVRDRSVGDTVLVTDRVTKFREVKICSERGLIRIRHAEVQLGNGHWQRLFVPLILGPGRCSDAVDLLGQGRRLRYVRVQYHSWIPGMSHGTVTVKALPYVQIQPR